jgi:putative flippase GtrA
MLADRAMPFLPRALSVQAARLRALAGQFLRFGLVGLVGYAVDVAVLLLGVRAGLDPFTARLPSFIAAASTTFLLNRRFTFRASAGAGRHAHRQWMLFVLLMLPGLALNYGTYAFLGAHWPFGARVLAVPVFAGALAGMMINFLLAKRIVFRS